MANNLSNTGLFVVTTFDWDINVLYDTKVDSPQFKELLVRLYQNINSMCLALNLKDSAYYVQQEFLNSQAFFPNPSSSTNLIRQAFRMVVNFGPLPNNSTISVPHNIDITSTYTFTRIYGAASDTISLAYIPLPFADATGADNIQLGVTATDVVITTTANYSNYTTTYVVLEYLKN